MIRDAVEDFLATNPAPPTEVGDVLDNEHLRAGVAAVEWLRKAEPRKVVLFANLFREEDGTPKVKILHKVRLHRKGRRRTIVAQWHPLKELLKGEGLTDLASGWMASALQTPFEREIRAFAQRSGAMVREWRGSEEGLQAVAKAREKLVNGLREGEVTALKEALRPLSKSGWTGEMVMRAWAEVLCEGVMGA